VSFRCEISWETPQRCWTCASLSTQHRMLMHVTSVPGWNWNQQSKTKTAMNCYDELVTASMTMFPLAELSYSNPNKFLKYQPNPTNFKKRVLSKDRSV